MKFVQKFNRLQIELKSNIHIFDWGKSVLLIQYDLGYQTFFLNPIFCVTFLQKESTQIDENHLETQLL